MGNHALDGSFPDPKPVHLRAGKGQGHPDARPGVSRPRDHLHHLSRIQDQALQAGAGDGVGLEDPGEDHAAGYLEDPFHAVGFKAEAGEPLLQNLGAFQLGHVAF